MKPAYNNNKKEDYFLENPISLGTFAWCLTALSHTAQLATVPEYTQKIISEQKDLN